VLVASLLAGSAVLTGCSSSSSSAAAANGVESKPGTEVLAAALAAADSQTSVRMVTKGKRDNLPFAVDMRIRRGGGASGNVWIGAEKLSIVTTATDVFVKADEAYWKTLMEAKYATAIGTMWVKAPVTSSTFAPYALFGDFDGLLGTYLRPDGVATRGDVSTIVTTPAVPVVSSQGSVWVAATGTPYPVQVDTPSTGDITRFGEWGSAVDVPVPSLADTIDLGALGVK
jgi:hypothetical protein